MSNRRNLIRVSEIFLIVFVWLVLLIVPVLFPEENNRPIMESVLNQFKTLVPLSILLIANRLYLVPRFLFKGRMGIYLVALTCIISLLSFGIYTTESIMMQGKTPMEEPYGKPGTPPANGPKPPPPPGQDITGPVKPPGQRSPEPVPAFANFLVLSILIIGFDTGLRVTLRWSKAEQEKAILEKENVAAQLLLLRNQISPHFFMNTLNNIHALMDINPEEAKAALIRLSKMMRHLLPETKTMESTLSAEVELIESYVRLMKIRLSERVKIMIDLPTNLPDKPVQPFLFIPLVENAFKQGISYKDHSFISIGMEVGDERLLFTVKNSKVNDSQSDGSSGVAMDITRKRLDLLYGKDYHLDEIENEEIYTINLSIPL